MNTKAATATAKPQLTPTQIFIYHSPEGDRELAGERNEDGTVELYTLDADDNPLTFNGEKILEIGKCHIGEKTGNCSLKGGAK